MKKIITILASICIFSFVDAQEKYTSIIERVANVDYIFEGIVLETKPYKTIDEKMIYTSNLIEITKVFKGDLECGTIELITSGGSLPDREVTVTHVLELEKGHKGLFLTQLTNKELSAVNFFNETNLEKMEAKFETQSYVKYLEEGALLKAFDLFQSWDSLAQLYDLTTLVTSINYVDCNNASLLISPPQPIIDEQPQVFPNYSQQEYLNLMAEADYQKANFTRSKSNTRATNTITYKLANLKITGTTTKYLEFDVTVKDNIGGKYLDQSAVRIKYPTNVFGSNIVANNKILVTRGSINADPNCYSNVVPTDRTNNVFFVPALEKVFSQCKSNINTTPLSIMHIKMEIQNCNVANATIAIEDTVTPFIGGTLMGNYSAFAEFPNDTFQTYYDIADANDVKAIPSCRATITDFYPKTVNGGVKDTVSVLGFQFGNTRGNGNLYFYDANFPSTGMSVPLEDSDYITWSDTLIQFYVPSLDTGANEQPIGTGKFRIVNNSLEKDTTDLPLNIFYSLINVRNANGAKHLHYLSNEQNSGGYKIYLDTAVYNNAPLMGCINKAVREWVCATGVNLTIAGDTFGVQTGTNFDGINLISFGATPGNSVAYTAKGRIPCLPSGFLFQDEFDIVLNAAIYQGQNLVYDTTLSQQIPYNHIDFYRAILHEFGHAVGHAHVIQPNFIMHWQLPIPPQGGLPANQRFSDIRYDVSAIQGGRKMVNTCAALPPIAGCYSPMIPLPTCAGYNSITDIADSKTDIVCYPNPFTNFINIEAQKSTLKNIELISLEGKLIQAIKPNGSVSSLVFEIPKDLVIGTYFIKITDNENQFTIKKLLHY